MYIAPDRYGIRLRVHEVYNIPRDKKKKEEKKERKSPLYLYGHTYSMSRDQPGKVADPSRGQLNREKFIFPCPRSCLRIWSRETGSVIPSRVSLLISIHRLNLVLTYGIPPKFRGGVHLFIHNRYAIGSVPSVSGHAITYRWRSLPRVRRHSSSKPQCSSERMLPWQVTMDQ